MLLAALIVLASDFRRMLNFFVFNKEIEPRIHHNGFEDGKEPKAFFFSKVALKLFFQHRNYFLLYPTIFQF